MEEDTVVVLPRPGSGVMHDPLSAVLCEGATRMLTQAIEPEVEAFLAAHAALHRPDQARRGAVTARRASQSGGQAGGRGR